MREMAEAIIELPRNEIEDCRGCRFYKFIQKNDHFIIACLITSYGNSQCQDMEDEEKAVDLMRAKCPFLEGLKKNYTPPPRHQDTQGARND